MDNQNLFSQSYDQIITQVLGGSTQYFQMLGNPQSFNWPVAPSGQLSPQAYQLMSAAPVYSPISEFSGVGTSTLFDNYKQIFSHVGFNISQQQQQQIQNLSNQATSAQNAIVNATTAANTAYQTAKQNGGVFFETQYPTPADWFNGPGDTYMKQIATEKHKADAIFDQIQALNAANQPTTLQQAMNAIKMPTTPPSGGNAPRGWTVVPNGAGVLEWQPDFTIGTNSQNWRAQLSDGSIGAKTITLDASKGDSSITKSWAGASFSYSGGFWGVEASGSWSKTDITKNDNSVKVTINLQSATNVGITPGAWFDGGFMKQLVTAGNTGTGYQILSPYTVDTPPHALFGRDGLCSTMVTGLVVAYKPSFSLEMASSTYALHQQQFQAATAVRIGPFSFGAHGGHFSQQVHTTGNRTTITGGSTSDDPVILGVTVGFPGTEKP